MSRACLTVEQIHVVAVNDPFSFCTPDHWAVQRSYCCQFVSLEDVAGQKCQ